MGQDLALPVLSIAAAVALFGVFAAVAAGSSPPEVWAVLYQGAFGSWFSWQNTLQRAAPLMLTALCVALPARAGLVIIGGEGALVLGGLGAAALPYAVALPENLFGTVAVCLAGMVAGALWIMLAGALRQYRGINETISSLLLAYVAIVYGASAIAMNLIAAIAGQGLLTIPTAAWLPILALAIGPQLAGHTLINASLRHLSATFVALAILGEPIGSALLAWLLLGETIAPLQGAGAHQRRRRGPLQSKGTGPGTPGHHLRRE
jgi:ABC-type uncharacterized transport system permease subunit